jgi:hypothetical protein
MMQKFIVNSVNKALADKKANSFIEKSDKEIKLTKEEYALYLECHIEDDVTWRVYDLLKINKNSVTENGYALTVQSGDPVTTLDENSIEEMVIRAYKNIIRSWKYDTMLLQACRTLKIDKDYIRTIINEIVVNAMAKLSANKSMTFWKAGFQEGKTYLKK